MRILVLCEGDAETRDSWSGVSNGLITGLRAAGHEVRAGDCDLYGASRLLGAALTFSPRRRRWWVRYHLTRIPFALRSRVAAKHMERSGHWADVILQFGATFQAPDRPDVPFYLYCDANIHLSELGTSAGRSEAAHLAAAETAGVRHREAAVYSRARLIFTMSRMVADTFVEGFGVARARLVPVHAGVNTSPAVGADHEPRPHPTILFVGRDFERKGGDLLLRAFERLRRELPDASLVIVGPPSDPAPGTPGVEHMGFLDLDDPEDSARLEAAYRSADVFCLPTRFEPLGIVFLEAMAFGVPCVGPRAWAVPEMITHGETGLLVDGDDPADWAAALLQFLTDRTLARRMGDAGQERVAEYFTWQRVARTMSESIAVDLSEPAAS